MSPADHARYPAQARQGRRARAARRRHRQASARRSPAAPRPAPLGGRHDALHRRTRWARRSRAPRPSSTTKSMRSSTCRASSACSRGRSRRLSSGRRRSCCVDARDLDRVGSEHDRDEHRDIRPRDAVPRDRSHTRSAWPRQCRGAHADRRGRLVECAAVVGLSAGLHPTAEIRPAVLTHAFAADLAGRPHSVKSASVGFMIHLARAYLVDPAPSARSDPARCRVHVRRRPHRFRRRSLDLDRFRSRRLEARRRHRQRVVGDGRVEQTRRGIPVVLDRRRRTLAVTAARPPTVAVAAASIGTARAGGGGGAGSGGVRRRTRQRSLRDRRSGGSRGASSARCAACTATITVNKAARGVRR